MSRGTPTPPGYGYLTHHLPRRATHTWLSGLASRQASPGDRNKEETRLYTQIHRCLGLDSRNEHTLALKVPLHTELRFHSRGYEQPPHRRACGTTTSRWLAAAHSCSSDNDLRSGRPNISSDDLRTDAATTRPSPTSPLEGQGQAIKAKEPEVGPRVALMVSSTEKLSPAATTSAPTAASTCPPTPHQRAPAAPKRTGRSSLPSSPRKREWDRPRTRVPPSWHTTCCETPWCGWPLSPGQRTKCCTLAGQQQFAFPGMAGGRLLHRAGGWFPPPEAEGRSGTPSHARAGQRPQPGLLLPTIELAVTVLGDHW
jgi:hypothetical protein